MNRTQKAAVVGAAAGVTWKAVEPLLQRAFSTPYSDAGIAAGLVAQGTLRLPAEFATQAIGGTIFGTVFGRLGGRGPAQGVASAMLENAAFWPVVALLQRWHPDVRSGRWPKPFTDPRALGVSFAGHAIFGTLLGAGLRR